jgi:hypothetical protein
MVPGGAGLRGVSNPVADPRPAVDDEPAVSEVAEARSGRLLRRLAVIAAFLVPVIAYVAFIHMYSVNVVWGDQWADVRVIRHLYAGTLNPSVFWHQHNEERMFFPNILVVLLTLTTKFNVVDESYVGALLLVASIGLIAFAHRRRSHRPWLFYLPLAVLMLSFVQFTNSLWGFQAAWFIVLASFATTLVALDRPRLDEAALIIAMIAAVVGSFSLLQGLLIWPVGLLLLYQRRRPWKYVAVWCAAGVLTVFLYTRGLVQNADTNGWHYALRHLLLTVRFFFTAIGDVLGIAIPPAGPGSSGNNLVLVFGIAVFAVAVFSMVRFGVRRDEQGAAPVGVALVVFGLLFAATVAVGRARFGLWAASSSIYTTCDLLTLAGLYLIWFEQARLARPAADAAAPDGRVTNLAVRGFLVFAIVAQVLLGIGHGLTGARATRNLTQGAADYLVAHGPASDLDLRENFDYTASVVRVMEPVLRQHHLSTFSSAPPVTRSTGTVLTSSTSPLYRVLGGPGHNILTCKVVQPGQSFTTRAGSDGVSLATTTIVAPPATTATVEARTGAHGVTLTDIAATDRYLNVRTTGSPAPVTLIPTFGVIEICWT